MTPTDWLAAELTALSAGLDDPAVDLALLLDNLAAAARAAVRGYRGLSLTIAHDGLPVTFKIMDGVAVDHPAVTSVTLPLPELAGTEPGGVLTLFADVRGSFVDLAADLSWATGVPLPAFLVADPERDHEGRTTGSRDFSAVHQAIGVLLDRGLTPDRAREELRRLAAADGGNIARAARAVLDSLPRTASPPPG